MLELGEGVDQKKDCSWPSLTHDEQNGEQPLRDEEHKDALTSSHSNSGRTVSNDVLEHFRLPLFRIFQGEGARPLLFYGRTGPLAGRELVLIWDKFCSVILYFAMIMWSPGRHLFFSLLHGSVFCMFLFRMYCRQP